MLEVLPIQDKQEQEAIANLCGVPALSFPAGMGKKGLPIGVQLLAPE